VIYEESDMIIRTIRDIFTADIDAIYIDQADAYERAKEFLQLVMPRHVDRLQHYNGREPLFHKYKLDEEIAQIHKRKVPLRGGGSIVIDQTEALVAIDVNSGKSTREFSIEETALATNLEASDEIARQLKLRDLAGLIVIDFIDMEEKRNNRAVERRLKDALRFDRARIQLGRISHFGLMEMSRQRLRTGVLEGSTSQCPHCQGTGIIRSTESIALAVLRGLEDAITAGAHAPLIATTTPTVALYILNSKRPYITEMEARHGYPVTVVGSDRIQGANFTVERGTAAALPARRPERAAVNMDWGFEGEGEEEAPTFDGANIETVEDPDDADAMSPRDSRGPDAGRDRGEGEGEEDGGRGGRRGRRRGRGRGRDRERGEDNRLDARSDTRRGEFRPNRAPVPAPDAIGTAASFAAEDLAADNDTVSDEQDDAEVRPSQPNEARDDRPGRRRRRGRRGGRRGRERDGEVQPREAEFGQPGSEPVVGAEGRPPLRAHADLAGFGPQPDITTAEAELNGGSNDATRRQHRPERQRSERIWDVETAPAAPQPAARSALEAVSPPAAPRVDSSTAPVEAAAPLRRRHEADSSEARIERVVVRPDQVEPATEDGTVAPQRKGWWQRRFGSE
jgi:ribonuclease E